MAYIKFKNVNKIYNKSRKINVLDDVNFDILKNDFVVITGSTGSGKTTILDILAGFNKISSGDVVVDNILLSKINNKNLNNYIRKYVGYVSFNDELIEDETILENILLSINLTDEKTDAEKLIDKLDLTNYLNDYPCELSKSQRIKVMLLMALCKNPKIILCDEIFLNMDKKDIKQVLKVLLSYKSKNKIPLIITSTDNKYSAYANKNIHLKNGKIEKIKINKKPKPIGDFK